LAEAPGEVDPDDVDVGKRLDEVVGKRSTVELIGLATRLRIQHVIDIKD
jgi:hypothetical protein